MKRKQYWVEQIVAALKQAEPGMLVADLARQLRILEQMYCRWRKQYAGLKSNPVRELKLRQDEHEQLRKLVSEPSLDKAILRDIAPRKSSRVRAEEASGERHRGSLRFSDPAGVPGGQASFRYPLLAQRQGPADSAASTHA